MSTPRKLHRWGNPDVRGIRACNNAGCMVRVKDSFRQWQRFPGAPWRNWLRHVDGGCAGGGPRIEDNGHIR